MIDRQSMFAMTAGPRETPTYAMAASTGESPIAEGTASTSAPLAAIEDATSQPVVEVVEADAASEPSLVAWEPDLRIADDAANPDTTAESLPAQVDGDGEPDGPAERPSQSRFFADAEARRLSRIKR